MYEYKNTKQKYSYLVFLEGKHVVQPVLSLKVANTNLTALYLSKAKLKTVRNLSRHIYKLLHLLTDMIIDDLTET